MKIELFETSEKDNKLFVKVKIEAYKGINVDGKHRVTMTAKAISEMLIEKKIKHGKCFTPNNKIHNWRHVTRENEWIFKIPVDKSAKKVTLKKETAKPKTTRRRRSRKVTTPAPSPTEE